MGNRLSSERSPYLLQHKDNPVDWWAWSDEAFVKAKLRDVPVFLSIGYATCHWCHVMEHESFEDPAVAQLMNQAFVNVKVDREERPDLDSIYMTVCQMLTGSGGWPLTIIMTPDREPLWAGTYIPRLSRYGRIGMVDLIPRVQHAWRQSRDEVESNARAITDALRQGMQVDTRGGDPTERDLEDAFEHLQRTFDPVHGGFGSAPKFPSPHTLLFLLRYWRRTEKNDALQMVEKTLGHMRLGGIFDHVGFGFHRYSTDREWKVPHFEKMLYDQAMAVLACVEAYRATKKPEYMQTACETITYVLRDLRSTDGGFCCAEDADSEGREGKFYVWHQSELEEVLGPELSSRVVCAYNIEAEGNFLEEATRRRTGENILFLRNRTDEDGLEEARTLLLAHRSRRVRPLLDDKVLTDWNGLMIAALARAGRVLRRPDYTKAAEEAAAFVGQTMLRGERLFHRFRDGEAGIQGMLDDYAFFVSGLLELYGSTHRADYLQMAIRLTDTCIEYFAGDGAFFLTASDAEALIVRPRDAYDGALPSGNSVMAMNLMRLSRLTGRSAYYSAASDIFQFFAKGIRARPAGFTAMLSAIEFGLEPSVQVVVAGDPMAADTQAMLSALDAYDVPDMVVHVVCGNDLIRVVPFLEAYTTHRDSATAYVCRDYQCERPTTDVAEMLSFLEPMIETTGYA